MNLGVQILERRLRTAALLILAGVLVEVVSLFWHKPTAMILFIGVGAVLVMLGIAYYVFLMVKVGRHLW